VKPCRILIADDERTQRQMLAGFLAKQGHQVAEAEDGLTARDHVLSHPVDLLLTDMRMPGLSGTELLEAVREINPLIQVIVITAFGTVETAVAAMQNGAFTFISKPIDLDALSAHIERALERKWLVEENRELRTRLEPTPVSDMIAACRLDLKSRGATRAPSAPVFLDPLDERDGRTLARETCPCRPVTVAMNPTPPNP